MLKKLIKLRDAWKQAVGEKPNVLGGYGLCTDLSKLKIPRNEWPKKLVDPSPWKHEELFLWPTTQAGAKSRVAFLTRWIKRLEKSK